MSQRGAYLGSERELRDRSSPFQFGKGFLVSAALSLMIHRGRTDPILNFRMDVIISDLRSLFASGTHTDTEE